MSEIKLFEGAEIETKNGRIGTVLFGSMVYFGPTAFFLIKFDDEEVSVYPANGKYKITTEHDVVKILNPQDAPDFIKNNGWLPIETAPKDKTIILGYFDRWGFWQWDNGMWVSQEDIDKNVACPVKLEEWWNEVTSWPDDLISMKPTHWKPSPTPPIKG